jgi:hypothetical protein
MRTTKFLENFFDYGHMMMHHAVADLTDEEWETRIADHQNKLGYIAWHLPRVQDNMIQTWIRGLPEVVHGERWAHWEKFRHLGVGVGITLKEADDIASGVNKADVLAYEEVVYQEALVWLRQLNDADLDLIPDAQKHLVPYPEYQTAGYHEETDGHLGEPTWELLMRPCIGHIQRHLGEIMTVKAVLREGG